MKNKLLLVLLFSFVLVFGILIFSQNVFASSNSTTSCVEKWVCDDWDSCRYGERERDCWDENHCGTIDNKPSEIRSCNRDYDDCYYGRYNRRYNDCIRINRNYYDAYQLELINYYKDKYKPAVDNKPQEPIQVINVQYSPDNYKRYPVSQGFYLDKWWIILGILGLLTLIVLILVIVVALRR